MVELFFCLTAMLFMAWVIVLKLREDLMKKEIHRLLQELKKAVEKSGGDVRISAQEHTWGHKPFWLK